MFNEQKLKTLKDKAKFDLTSFTENITEKGALVAGTYALLKGDIKTYQSLKALRGETVSTTDLQTLTSEQLTKVLANMLPGMSLLGKLPPKQRKFIADIISSTLAPVLGKEIKPIIYNILQLEQRSLTKEFFNLFGIFREIVNIFRLKVAEIFERARMFVSSIWEGIKGFYETLQQSIFNFSPRRLLEIVSPMSYIPFLEPVFERLTDFFKEKLLQVANFIKDQIKKSILRTFARFKNAFGKMLTFIRERVPFLRKQKTVFDDKVIGNINKTLALLQDILSFFGFTEAAGKLTTIMGLTTILARSPLMKAILETINKHFGKLFDKINERLKKLEEQVFKGETTKEQLKKGPIKQIVRLQQKVKHLRKENRETAIQVRKGFKETLKSLVSIRKNFARARKLLKFLTLRFIGRALLFPIKHPLLTLAAFFGVKTGAFSKLWDLTEDIRSHISNFISNIPIIGTIFKGLVWVVEQVIKVTTWIYNKLKSFWGWIKENIFPLVDQIKSFSFDKVFTGVDEAALKFGSIFDTFEEENKKLKTTLEQTTHIKKPELLTTKNIQNIQKDVEKQLDLSTHELQKAQSTIEAEVTDFKDQVTRLERNTRITQDILVQVAKRTQGQAQLEIWKSSPEIEVARARNIPIEPPPNVAKLLPRLRPIVATLGQTFEEIVSNVAEKVNPIPRWLTIENYNV